MNKVSPSSFSEVQSRSFVSACVPTLPGYLSEGTLSNMRVEQSCSRTTGIDRDGPSLGIQVCQILAFHSSRISEPFISMGVSVELNFLGKLSEVPAFLFTCKEVKWFIEWHSASPCHSLSFSALLPLLISCHGQRCLMFIRDEYVRLGRRGCYKYGMNL